MNLFLLVEGRQTESKVYPAWLGHLMPQLRRVRALDEISADNYVLVSGNGYPSYRDRINETLNDIAEKEKIIDHYIVCVDSENVSSVECQSAVAEVVAKAERETKVRVLNPMIQTHIVVQHCCIACWL